MYDEATKTGLINMKSYSARQAADHIGVSTKTLDKWRSESTGPVPYYPNGYGKKPVLYTEESICTWLESKQSPAFVKPATK